MNIPLANIKTNAFVHRIMLVVVFVIGVSFLLCLERAAVPLTKDGVHFQRWSSDVMWQALNSSGLRAHPFQSLWYLHKEPPLYDIIRAVLTGCLQNVPDKDLPNALDRFIYIVWALCFGLIAALIYEWLRRVTSPRFAFYCSMAWILNPAPIAYATFLDPTILVSLLVLWFFYELWRLYCKEGSITRLVIVAVLLFYLRASFQWYFFVLVAVTLMLMRIPRRELLKFAVISALLVAPYIVKQYCVFKVVSSTFLGQHMYFMVAGDRPYARELKEMASSIAFEYPKNAVLSIGKLNTRDQWQKNFAYYQLADQYVKAHPVESVKNVARTFFVYNWHQYWRPSATYQPNAVLRALPWQDTFNRYSSYPANFLVIIFAFLLWRKARRDAGMPVIDRGILGVGMLVFYMFLTATLVNGDGKGWTEAVRYKFFLEPVCYVFVFSQFYALLVTRGGNKPGQ